MVDVSQYFDEQLALFGQNVAVFVETYPGVLMPNHIPKPQAAINALPHSQNLRTQGSISVSQLGAKVWGILIQMWHKRSKDPKAKCNWGKITR